MSVSRALQESSVLAARLPLMVTVPRATSVPRVKSRRLSWMLTSSARQVVACAQPVTTAKVEICPQSLALKEPTQTLSETQQFQIVWLAQEAISVTKKDSRMPLFLH